MSKQPSLKEIACLFLKLGLTAFGGPAAHIAMMKREVVEKRKWISEMHFLDLVGATNLIPGPNSTEMAIHIGHEKAGIKGLMIAGICFIFPAVIITGAFAWFYKQYGQLPSWQFFFYGIKPAIISVIIAATYPLAKKALKNKGLVMIALLSIGLCFGGINELLILLIAGMTYLLFIVVKKPQANSFSPVLLLSGETLGFFSTLNLKLFLSFLKIGSVLYGSGYVLFAFLDAELVSEGLLSRQQLLDAIAVGQFTPGPVFSSVTFIGFQMNGWGGAIVSTLGVFIPSFLFVALLNPLIPKIRKSVLLSSFLDAVNVASLALVFFVCYQMGKETLLDWRPLLIACISMLVLLFFKNINSVWIVLGGSLTGYLLHFL